MSVEILKQNLKLLEEHKKLMEKIYKENKKNVGFFKSVFPVYRPGDFENLRRLNFQIEFDDLRIKKIKELLKKEGAMK